MYKKLSAYIRFYQKRFFFFTWGENVSRGSWWLLKRTRCTAAGCPYSLAPAVHRHLRPPFISALAHVIASTAAGCSSVSHPCVNFYRNALAMTELPYLEITSQKIHFLLPIWRVQELLCYFTVKVQNVHVELYLLWETLVSGNIRKRALNRTNTLNKWDLYETMEKQ